MPIRFECTHCPAKYDVADDMAGKTILCRSCEKRGTVPSAATPPPGSAPRPTLPAAAALRQVALPTRRSFLTPALAYGVPAGLLVFAGIYYWSRPFPWERLRDPRPGEPGGPPARPPGDAPKDNPPPGGQAK
jgi:hypothetical protein